MPGERRDIKGGQLLGRVVSPYTFETLEEIPTPFENGIMIMQHLTRNVVEVGRLRLHGRAISKARRTDCPRAGRHR